MTCRCFSPRRYVHLLPPERYGSKPEDWESRAAEARRGMADTIAQCRAAGWSDAYAGEAVRDRLEGIEICSINVELLNRTGSFDDPAWIERRSLAARTRLEATTDPLLLPGYRKLVRKWNEEIMRFQAEVRIKSRMACGNQAAAEAAYREFVAWMKRPDQKTSTRPNGLRIYPHDVDPRRR
jgi:hypothetical protein